MAIKKLFFWADGLGETKYPTSLELAKTPYIDKIASESIIGLYDFGQINGFEHPHTDIIIPAFFGLNPEEYIGRGGLDLIDQGIKFQCNDTIFTFRITPKLKDNSKTMFYFNGNENIINYIISICNSSKTNCKLNPQASHKNQFVLWGQQEKLLREKINSIHLRLINTIYQISNIEENIFHQPKILKNDVILCGWAKGSLRGAFRLINSKIVPTSTKLYDYKFYEEDFFNNLDQIKEMAGECNTYVFYLKETDKASHKSNQNEKIKAIEFCDKMIKIIHENITDISKTILIADHNTNINSPNAEYGPTPFLIFDGKNRRGLKHFCERMIIDESQNVIGRKELNKLI